MTWNEHHMDDHSFFDMIYQFWTRTTGAETTYWEPEEDEAHYSGGPGTWNIWAVGQDQDRKHIASHLTNEDAEFIVSIHGCIGDLIKRLLASTDEADRLDEEKDHLIHANAKLEQEADEFQQIIADLNHYIEQIESGRV